MKRLKKLIVLGTVISVLATSSLGASAAGVRDTFNAEYYANQNEDVKKVLGNDEDALFQHYLQYGLKEGRQGNPLFNVALYRKSYADLEVAFGDDWDAYVDHYYNYGIKEKRVAGALFDPLAYAEAYPDIKAAFGNDIEAITNHYLTYGIKEGRTAGVTPINSSEKVTAASEKPSQPSAPTSNASNSDSDSSDTNESSSENSNNQTSTPTVEPIEHEHNFTYTSNSNGTHAISCNAQNCGNDFATSGECDTAGAEGACSKCGYKEEAEEHEHNFTYTSNSNGTHAISCNAQNCGNDFATSGECDTAGAEGACSKCGYKEEAEEHEHNFTYTSNSNGTHAISCNAQNCGNDFATSGECDTAGAEGACSKCGYKEEEGVVSYKIIGSGTIGDDKDISLADPEDGIEYNVEWNAKKYVNDQYSDDVTYAIDWVFMSDSSTIVHNFDVSDGKIVIRDAEGLSTGTYSFKVYLSEVDGKDTDTLKEENVANEVLFDEEQFGGFDFTVSE